MIDLDRTRASLLASIGASDRKGAPPAETAELGRMEDQVHLILRGCGREDLFPPLEIALSERFGDRPRQEVIRDLLMPLKNALGNAWKRGNGLDPAKSVSVEVVVTREGILLAVTDEGRGFDVSDTLRRFRDRRDYFVHHGSGFRNLDAAAAVVTYEDAGRTLLLCYRPGPRRVDAAPPAAADERDPGGPPASSHRDAGGIEALLSAGLPRAAEDPDRLEVRRVVPCSGASNGALAARLLVRLRERDGGPPSTRILTGRLHRDAAAAAADFEAARGLRESMTSRRLRIPEPLARPRGESRLILFDFNPWMTLRHYLAYRGSLEALLSSARRIGRALAALHDSRPWSPRLETRTLEERLGEAIRAAERRLAAGPRARRDLVRYRLARRRVARLPMPVRRDETATVHGAFDWDCVQYGVDGRFYLFRLEACARSDPGVDLGGYLADLLRFTLARGEAAAYAACRDAFLDAYNARAARPAIAADLSPYVVLALIERLSAAPGGAGPASGSLIDAIEVACREPGPP